MVGQAKIVFLDRDGTINKDLGYDYTPETLELLPGATESLAVMRRSGFALMVVSNQSGVGRGLMSEDLVHATNAALRELLLSENDEARIDDFAFCPHHPDAACDCRKPNTGLLNRFSSKPDFDPALSWMIGDKISDVMFGRNIGIPAAQSILVRTGHGRECEAMLPEKFEAGDHPPVCESIVEAAQLIVERSK